MQEFISYGHLRIGDLALHRNRGMELTYITRGRMEWVVGDRVETVGQGDLFFTLPWQVHGSPVADLPDNSAWHLLFRLGPARATPPCSPLLDFPAALGLSPPEVRFLSESFRDAARHCWPANARIRRLFPWMVEELEQGTPTSIPAARNLLRLVLLEFARLIRAGSATEPESGTGSEARVRSFLTALPRRCGEEWDLGAMAQACGMQRTHFTNTVRRLTGYPPAAYLLRTRIDLAGRILKQTRMPVTEVAMRCGFGSSQYFANVFRKQTGVTPSEFRRRLTGPHPATSGSQSTPWRSLREERERVERFRIRDRPASRGGGLPPPRH